MAQFFPHSANAYARTSIALIVLLLAGVGLGLDRLQRSPWVTKEGERMEQPVPFSHQHHVAGEGIDCRYCHTSVENSSFAGFLLLLFCLFCFLLFWFFAAFL